MVNNRWPWLFIAFTCLSAPAVAVTQLQAQIDKNPVMYGEEILLQIQADEKLPREAIDFTVLDKDFRVNGPAISQSMQIINGHSSQTTIWQLALYPKRTGDIEIPGFQIDAVSTQPIVITVLEKPTNAEGQQADLFVTNTLSGTDLHVQQMAYYEVKIFFKGDLKSGALSPPNVAGCAIEQVGKDVESSELVNGERYQTITRRYSVTPQQSGDFTLEAPFFKGEMIDRSNSNYDYYAKHKTESAEGKPLTFSAKPIPADFNGDWLVSELVALTEEWSVTGDEITQGEPVTRTITLTALDLMENQLPDLKMTSPAGVKVYPEQPQAKKAERNGRIVAQKVFSFAVIANKAGEIELPEISIPWYNSQTKQLTSTTLAKKRLKVLPNANLPAPEQVVQSEIATPTAIAAVSDSWWLPTWQMTYSSLLLVVGLLFTASALIWQLLTRSTTHQRQAAKANSSPAHGAEVQIKFSRHKFKAACLANDAELTQQLLLRWGSQLLNPTIVTGADLLAALPEGELKQQIFELFNWRYQAVVKTWHGQILFELWAKYQHQQLVDDSAVLKPLYPKG